MKRLIIFQAGKLYLLSTYTIRKYIVYFPKISKRIVPTLYTTKYDPSSCCIINPPGTKYKCQPSVLVIIIISSLLLISSPTSNFVQYTLDILFPSNHNIHKSLSDLPFFALDFLIERFC